MSRDLEEEKVIFKNKCLKASEEEETTILREEEMMEREEVDLEEGVDLEANPEEIQVKVLDKEEEWGDSETEPIEVAEVVEEEVDLVEVEDWDKEDNK